jgi:hypothetical protein
MALCYTELQQLSGRILHVKISQEQADALSEILRLAGDHPSRCHCCVAKPQHMPHVTFGRLWREIFGVLRIKRQKTSGTAKGPYSAATTYTPAQESTSVPSSSTTLPTFVVTGAAKVSLTNSGTSNNSTQVPGLGSNSPATTGQKTPTRIVFGTDGVRRSLEIEQIEICDQMNDQVFFSQLKMRHKKHRSLFRRLLSPFRFRHCNFVKVGALSHSLPHLTKKK